VVGVLLARYVQPRVNLIWGQSNNSLHNYRLDNGTKIEIYCQKYFLQNTGRVAAHEVEFVLSWAPDDLRVWQPRDHVELNLRDGQRLVRIPFISPQELVIIDVVWLDKRAAFVESVKCVEGLGRQVRFVTQRDFGKKVGIMAFILMVLGVAFVLSLAINLVS
jgi:hypothetical protein